MIEVESWPLQQFETARSTGTLKIAPEFQRRAVWKPKDEMLLIDSIARGIPIGAVTLYADTSQGYSVHEAIDGRQRLTAIIRYLTGDLLIRPSTVASAANDEDEFDPEKDEITAQYHNLPFEELGHTERMKLLQYRIPVFIVRGPRSHAIRAFTRMNQNSYPLKPQEIRNAFFTGTTFLNTVVDAIAELDAGSEGEGSLLVTLSVVSKDSWNRMQDVQLIAELLVMALNGPQHRRDDLDNYFELYADATGNSLKTLNAAKDRVVAAVKQVSEITAGVTLQAYHFPPACENDFYGLVGALLDRGTLSSPQMSTSRAEVLKVISTFRNQVGAYISRIRSGDTPDPEHFAPLVEEYGRGFLGGQQNGRERRRQRIKIWSDIINDVVAQKDPKGSFSDLQRRLIWGASEDKLCARCGCLVEWKDYHAGHRLAHALGGATDLENGQVEHARCNLSSGAGSN